MTGADVGEIAAVDDERKDRRDDRRFGLSFKKLIGAMCWHLSRR